MVKHIQTIRRQKPTNCVSVFDNFVGLALKGLTLQRYLIYFQGFSFCLFLKLSGARVTVTMQKFYIVKLK